MTMAAGLMAFGASAASAHVRVDPDSTAEGSHTQLTFSVPNESDTAKTSKLEITFQLRLGQARGGVEGRGHHR